MQKAPPPAPRLGRSSLSSWGDGRTSSPKAPTPGVASLHTGSTTPWSCSLRAGTLPR